MLLGHSTWEFKHKPCIITTGTVGGPFEEQGRIPEAFDVLHEDLWLNQKSFEQAQQIMMEESCDIALKKAGITKEQVEFFISGDLINQITPSTYAAKTLGVPFLGLFSACATSAESLALSAFIINAGGANYILSGTASRQCSNRKTIQVSNRIRRTKPPTAQWTVTGAGTALVAAEGTGPVITSATIGKVVDMGFTDPFNMGGAMAPAAADTIIRHLKDRNIEPDYYDVIVTGDLGKIGREASFDLLIENGITINDKKYMDCGIVMYKDDQPVNAGGSGSACSAIAAYGHFLQLMNQGKINNMLLVATGSLHSPMTIQQKNTIPVIAHAVSIENRGETI